MCFSCCPVLSRETHFCGQRPQIDMYKGQIELWIVESRENVIWLLPLLVKRGLSLWKETLNWCVQRTNRVVNCGVPWKRDLVLPPFCTKRRTLDFSEKRPPKETYKRHIEPILQHLECISWLLPSCQQKLTSLKRDVKKRFTRENYNRVWNPVKILLGCSHSLSKEMFFCRKWSPTENHEKYFESSVKPL